VKPVAFAWLLSLQAAAPPALVLGRFEDDYGSRHVITATDWQHGKAARYRIVEWNPARQFLVAANDAANPSDPGKWSRFDWMILPAGSGDPAYTWAYCMSAYDASTQAAAAAVETAKRETPRTGCSGFPFTRMRSAAVIEIDLRGERR